MKWKEMVGLDEVSLILTFLVSAGGFANGASGQARDLKPSAQLKISNRTPNQKAKSQVEGKSAAPGALVNGASGSEPSLKENPAKESPPPNSAQNAPPDQVTSGKSVDLSKAFLKEEVKPYSYVPIDAEFWYKIQASIAEGNPISALIEGARMEDSAGTDTPEGGEGQLAMAVAFRERKLYYASFDLLIRMAKDRIGSSLGEAALHELGKLTTETPYDQEALNRLLVGNEFASLHPDVESFVSYHKAMDLLQLGFTEWAQVHINRIKKDSYWDYLMQYWTAVGEVSRDRVDNALAIFQKLMETQSLPPRIFEKVALQYARLIFEQGDFQTSFAIYNSLGLTGVREIGRIQLERAWVHYYLKDYGKAMGILTALQAPYFEPSLTFERHILEMIIYRELCHYEAVKYVAGRFRSNFKSSLNAIRWRKPLRHDKALFNLVVLNREIQDPANLVDQVRRELAMIKEYSWDQFTFFKPLLQEYSRIDSILQARIDIQLEEKTRSYANELLDAEEQILFLEYTSRLDELRVRRGDDSTYRAQDISYITFEKIYWPADGEFWWDEMPDYLMKISSRCGEQSTPDDHKVEKEFR